MKSDWFLCWSNEMTWSLVAYCSRYIFFFFLFSNLLTMSNVCFKFGYKRFLSLIFLNPKLSDALKREIIWKWPRKQTPLKTSETLIFNNKKKTAAIVTCHWILSKTNVVVIFTFSLHRMIYAQVSLNSMIVWLVHAFPQKEKKNIELIAVQHSTHIGN